MKYIRTKDGIFKVIKNDHPFYTHVEMKYTPGVMMHESVIEKSADTIEELCDQIIGYTESGTRYWLTTSAHRLHYPLIKTVYGAIWTSKGLIYVAKMNEKGEFELL